MAPSRAVAGTLVAGCWILQVHATGGSSSTQLAAATVEQVSACPPDQRQQKSVCLILQFAEGSVGTTRVSCSVWPHDPTRTRSPAWNDFFGAPEVNCDMSHPCTYFVETAWQTQLEVDTTYDSFCIDWGTSFIPPFSIAPKCGGGDRGCGTVVSTGIPSKSQKHRMFGVVDILSVLLLMLYVAWSYLFDYIRVLHETGAAVLFGLIAGYAMHKISGQTAVFNYDLFSYGLLPMVIFGAGFNMEKSSFFRYSQYIILLGISGTVQIFIYIYYGSELFLIHPGDGLEPYKMQASHRLLMASVLSATDSVAPMAFLSAESFPQLYAVVFGEGVLNDVVSVLLSSSIENAVKLPALSEISLNIVKFLVSSSFMGICFGLAISLLFKHGKPLHHGVVKPSVILLGGNYACYILSELCDFSSIFALFVCAVLSGHYAQYSLAPATRSFVHELAELLAYTAEAVIFGYFGLTAVAYTAQGRTFQLDLIVYYICCIVVARVLAVSLLVLSIKLTRRRQSAWLSLQELCVVAMAGCMRGTIAFALILKALPPEEEQSHSERVLVTTVLGIVILNCLVFGGLFPVVMKALKLEPRRAAHLLSEEGPDQLAEVALAGGTDTRHGLHKWWHRVDKRWLKPVLRPSGPAEAEAASSEATAEMAHTSRR
ncbi:unnamed protein product [Polarella glacialis]|nr:unnamed protein product [Polarella glacialis]CAE8732198.1 unnamed protein product [Polarella glacialis]